MKNKAGFVLLIILLLFTALSCAHNPLIGVGNEIDTQPPMITIDTHENFDYVSGNFEYIPGHFIIGGECFDNIKVTRVFLRIEEGNHIILEEDAVIQGNRWSVKVFIDPDGVYGLSGGEYKFNVFAFDAMGNTSRESYKMITLIIDTGLPEVLVTHPPLKTAAYLRTLDYYNPGHLNYFQNRTFYIQGQSDDEYSIKNVTVSLIDEKGNTAVSKTINSAGENQKGVEGSVWSWRFYFTVGEDIGHEEDFQRDKKYYYTVNVRIEDTAGNVSQGNEGVICVYEKSDDPYTLLNDIADKVPASSIIAGNTHDDDGIETIYIRIAPDSEEPVDYETIREDFTDDTVRELKISLPHNPLSYTWMIETPSMPGNYKIYVTAADKFGNVFKDYTSTYVTKAFTVLDDEAPIISIDHIKDYKELVNTAGDFTVKGEIRDKAGAVKSYAAWIPENISGAYLVQSKWNSEILKTIEDRGGKYWELPLNSSTIGKEVVSLWNIKLNVNSHFNDEYKDKKIYIYAENASGKSSSELVIIPKDEEPPVISVTFPADGESFTTTGGNTFTINGKVTDLSRIEIFKVNDKTLTPDSNGNWSISSDDAGFSDMEGNITFPVYAKDVYGNENRVERSIIIDNNNPFIAYVTSENDAGYYSTGMEIVLLVNINKKVTVSGGVPSIKLNSHDNAEALYQSGSGTNRLRFTYKVKDGDKTPNLNHITNGFLLNGAEIKDDVGVPLNISLPVSAGSLGNNVSIEVDTEKPVIERITSANPNGTYKAGGSIIINAVFSENVTVTGEPRIKLSNGKYAVYTSGSSSSILNFLYTVGDGDDTAELDSTELDLTGVEIKDPAFNSFSGELPADNRLSNNKSLAVDTVKPFIVNITSINSNGDYKEGAALSIDVEFSENVFVTGVPELILNSASDAKASYSTGNGGKVLKFNYTAVSGHNSSDLSVGTVSGNIKDIAGNDAVLNIPSGKNLNDNKNIVIDTVKPAAPQLSGVISGTLYSADQTVTVGLLESAGEYRYALNNVWRSWEKSNGTSVNIPVTSENGTYNEYSFKAQQRDAAGNESDESTEISFKIDKVLPLLTEINSTTSSGLYKTGNVVNIELRFNKPVSVTAVTINLNNGRSISLPADTALKSSHSGDFTIASGNDTAKLNVTSISGTFKDQAGNILSPVIPSGRNLSDSKDIAIDTTAPLLSSQSITNTDAKLEFTLIFNEPVFKGTGNVTITRTADSFPVVMTTDEFTEWKSLIAALGSYYTYTSIGSTSAGVSDNTGRYVLNFNLDANDSTLTGLFKNAGYNTHSISIDSAQISITGNTAVITPSIDLKTGVEYIVNIPSGAFMDAAGFSYAGTSLTAFTRRNKAAAPVIRVNKVTGNGETQPQTTGVKISTETAGASIVYGNQTGSFAGTMSTNYASSFNIGAANYDGGRYYINARASKTGLSNSDTSYEVAYKTVLRTSMGLSTGGTMFFFRGGDAPSGAVGTPGFPFSWATDDYNGIKRANTTAKSLVTWAVNVRVYFHPLQGMNGWTEELGPASWKWRTEEPSFVEPGNASAAVGGGWEANWHDR